MAVKQHTASAPAGATRACPVCGTDISHRQRRTKYCSKRCQHLAVKESLARKCVVCGGDIPVEKNLNAKYCSDTCRDKARYLTESQKEKRREQNLQWRHQNKDIVNQRSRLRRQKNIEQYRDIERERARKFRQTEEGRQIVKQRAMDWRQRNRERYLELKKKEADKYRAKKKAEQGIFDAHILDRRRYLLSQRPKAPRIKKHEAHVTAFNAFKKTASDGWHARYWKRIGQPWRNPKLSPAQKFRIQYALDAGFRLYHINKAGWRRDALLERNDGTINFWALLKERKTCPYCGCKITRENAVADHMDPLKHGGNNGQHNLTICCRDCNTRKSGRPFAEWLDMLTPERRSAARRWYVRKHGCQPEQQAMTFAFTP